jgi:hypothetical protein
MVSMIGNGLYPCVIGSRILGGGACGRDAAVEVRRQPLAHAVRETSCSDAKLSEYHTGYRAFSRQLAGVAAAGVNSDDFVFDNQMLAQILWAATRSRR